MLLVRAFLICCSTSAFLHSWFDIKKIRLITCDNVNFKSVWIKLPFWSTFYAKFRPCSMHSLTNNSSDVGNSPGVGTKQYLPLELLDDSIFVVDFVYKHIGMWAFDLVLWTITKRTFKMLNPKRNKRKRKLLHGFFLVL